MCLGCVRGTAASWRRGSPLLAWSRADALPGCWHGSCSAPPAFAACSSSSPLVVGFAPSAAGSAGDGDPCVPTVPRMELALAPAVSVLQRDEGGELLPALTHHEQRRGVKADRAANLFWKCIGNEKLGCPFCVSGGAEVVVQPGSRQDRASPARRGKARRGLARHGRGDTRNLWVEAGGCSVRMQSPTGGSWRGCV